MRAVTTAGERAALPFGTIVQSSAGTIACRYDSSRGVCFGVAQPFPWEMLELPLVVLYDGDGPTPVGTDSTADALVALSRWIDAGNAHRDPEAVTWGRLAKIAEEAGEVIAAYIGATGQNPRKGITGTHLEVIEELLDVAVTALAAIEHLNGHDGRALRLLDNKILRVANRAGVAS